MRALLILLGLLLVPALARAQPALDGTNSSSATSGTTVSLTATTTANPEIVVVGASVRTSTTSNPSLSIAGCSLTWNVLGTPAQFNNSTPVGTATYGWYAQTASNLGACTITVTSSLTIVNASMAMCSFSGINASNPFDPHSGLPVTNTNATNSSLAESVNMSTTLLHDTMITTIGSVVVNQSGLGATTGATICAQSHPGTLNPTNEFLIYKTFTTAQSSFNIGVNANAQFFSVQGTALTADSAATGRSRLIQ